MICFATGSLIERKKELPPEEINRMEKGVKHITLLLRDRSKSEWFPIFLNETVPENIWVPGGDVKVIIHGYTIKDWQTWEENIAEQGIFDLGIAFSKLNESYNVLVLNWTLLSTEPLNRYSIAAYSTMFVGEAMAQFLVKLVQRSIIPSWENVHAMGLSLGGHTVGVLGHKVQELAPGAKIGRITGMDPAGPHFDVTCNKLPNDRSFFLDKSDGKFVDIIHTNLKTDEKSILGHLGSCIQSGHVDFYPNGGEHQERCTEADDIMEGCSHLTSVQYMRMSLTENMLGCPCQDWDTYLAGKCNCTLESGGNLMGNPCSPSASGKYFLSVK